MVSELTVIIKDPEKTLRNKFLCYHPYAVDDNDDYIKDCVKRTVQQFNGTPESIKIKIDMQVQ